MNNDIEVIKSIYEILDGAVNDTRTEYIHIVEEGKLNREQQLQIICELVMQQIENNFEWED